MDEREASRRLYWDDRDGSEYCCPGCGRPREAVDGIELHHRDRCRRNADPDNLIGLCPDCHQDGEHGNRRDDPQRLQEPSPYDTDPPSPDVDTPGF